MSWSLIDRERMFLVHRHQSLECINNLDYIETWNITTVTLEDTHAASFKCFSDYELKLLHENLCGEKFEGYNYEALIQSVAALIQRTAYTDANVSETIAQANTIPMSFNRENTYRYVKGASKPEETVDLFTPPAITAVENYVPVLKPNYVPKVRIETKRNVDIKPNPIVTAMMESSGSAPKTPRAPRDPSVAGSEAPRDGSKTKVVWTIADEIQAANPNLDKKALSKLVAARCEQEGVNPSTRSVQFSKWAASKGL